VVLILLSECIRQAEIMCPAQRVVEAIKKDAGPTGKWTAMHIRRGSPH
jgi:hypothetical protein